jgi:hypothetical protein
LVWEETSTILKRGRGSDVPPANTGENETHSHAEADGGAEAGGGEVAEAGAGDADDRPVTATWRLSGDLGRRYASVSGDMNPIHIHPVSARLLGFPAAIIHGMWTKARCLAALDPRLPERFGVEVSFRKPILLPATVQFAEGSGEPGIGFAVRGAGKGTPHLEGQVNFG